MIYYIFFLLLISEALLLKVFQQGRNNKYRLKPEESNTGSLFDQFFLILSFCELVALYSLRDVPIITTEGDLGRYIFFFISIAENGSGYEYLEPGFRLYMRTCSLIGETTPFILFTFSVPVIGLTMWFIKKYSRNVYLSIYIYYGFMYYFFLFNGVRQCIAMAIGLPAFYFINENKKIKAVFFIILACLFHYSAAILFLLFFVRLLHMKIDMKYFGFVTLGTIVFIILGYAFLNPIINTIASGYAHYLESDKYGAMGNIANPIIYWLILGIMCFLNNGREEKDNFLIYTFSISVLLYGFSLLVQIFNREAYYYGITIICALPNVISRIRDSRVRLLCIVGCYLAITIYGAILIENNAHGILPYELSYELGI